jgi:hypothetical protein
MGIKDKVLKRAKNYINDKNYNLDIVKKSEKSSSKETDKKDTLTQTPIYNVGDRVKLLDKDDFGIIYKQVDRFNNIQVFYNGEFIEVNVKRIRPNLKAEKLYPKGYDINSLFTSFKERKLEKDIKRGSKKALKMILKK